MVSVAAIEGASTAEREVVVLLWWGGALEERQERHKQGLAGAKPGSGWLDGCGGVLMQSLDM